MKSVWSIEINRSPENPAPLEDRASKNYNFNNAENN